MEHSSFTPLVFSATGGMGREATCFYKRLASMLAQKWDHSYSTTLCWLRCRLTFSPICSAIQSLRGARSSQHHAVHSPAAIDLAITESHIILNPLFHLKFPIFISFVQTLLVQSFILCCTSHSTLFSIFLFPKMESLENFSSYVYINRSRP